MRRSTPVLAVLLLASVLANAMLAVRLSHRPEPDPAAARRVSAERAVRPEESPAGLKESLDAERKKNDELRARIERLETDKKVLAQETSAPGAADKLAGFRAKLRKLMKVMKDPAAKAGAVDPDSMVELTETMMEFLKIAALRSKDPKTYSDYLQALYEVGLEGDGTALSAEQTATLSKLFQELGESLARIPQTPAGDRLLKEIELEGAAMSQLKSVLSEAQQALLSKENMNALAVGNMLSMSYVTKQGGTDQIAQQWSALYGLDPAQLPQAKVAAQSYLDAMARLDAENKSKGYPIDKAGSPESYDYRLRSVREQLAALNLLSASLTPAQQETVRTQTMREIFLVDASAVAPPVAEK
jgi:hypothetical protein